MFAVRRTPASRTDIAMHSSGCPRRSAGIWIGLRKELKIKGVILISKMTFEPGYHFITVALRCYWKLSFTPPGRLRKHAEPTETEMAFMGVLKASSIKSTA
jgi:hypothetical protein